jgi:hypothetical protein
VSCRISIVALLSTALIFATGCRTETGTPSIPSKSTSIATKEAYPLPNNGFKAQITLVDPPSKLRAGQKETLRARVKNVSEVTWYSHGGEINTNPDNRFYLAVGNRWLKSDGSLLTNMDGRYGIGKDLKPGEETEVPLQVTAPKDTGDYTLEIDLVQEQVAWFSDKGSATAKAKVSVVK